jgi:hypothetical protein
VRSLANFRSCMEQLRFFDFLVSLKDNCSAAIFGRAVRETNVFLTASYAKPPSDVWIF